jgi:hypothetical protein
VATRDHSRGNPAQVSATGSGELTPDATRDQANLDLQDFKPSESDSNFLKTDFSLSSLTQSLKAVIVQVQGPWAPVFSETSIERQGFAPATNRIRTQGIPSRRAPKLLLSSKPAWTPLTSRFTYPHAPQESYRFAQHASYRSSRHYNTCRG